MVETQYRKDPHTGKDYINYGGERVPEINRGYKVEMRHPKSGPPTNRADVVFVVPTRSAEEAVKEAKKRYPGYGFVSVREDS